MPYNFVADSIHTKKPYSRLSSSEVYFQTENGHFAILSPHLRVLAAVHLRLIGKRTNYTEFSIPVTAEALYANID